MHREPLRCDQCSVRQRAACAALGIDERRQLARLGHQRRLKRGDTLFAAGDDNKLSATLVSGLLKVVSFDEDGTEHILGLIHPAGFVGELFTSSTSHNVVALADAELCVFPRREYEAALKRFPSLAEALLRRSSRTLTETRSLMAAVTSRTAQQRIAGFLNALAQAAIDSECHMARRFDLVLTRGEIASLLGLRIETVSRQLTRMEEDGILRRHGLRSIELMDAGRLEQLAA